MLAHPRHKLEIEHSEAFKEHLEAHESTNLIARLCDFRRHFFRLAAFCLRVFQASFDRAPLAVAATIPALSAARFRRLGIYL
jgi:hypothetical protein